LANTQAICTSFKTELLTGQHVLTATNPARTINTADVFKAALFQATGTVDATTATYTAVSASEVTPVTGYTAGGVAVTWIAPASTPVSASTGTAYTTLSASIAWTVTGTLGPSFDCVLIYNSTQGNKAVSVHTFTAQTITNGTLTLTMPANNSTTGLVRFA
jgi:hypothetical protein